MVSTPFLSGWGVRPSHPSVAGEAPAVNNDQVISSVMLLISDAVPLFLIVYGLDIIIHQAHNIKRDPGLLFGIARGGDDISLFVFYRMEAFAICLVINVYHVFSPFASRGHSVLPCRSVARARATVNDDQAISGVTLTISGYDINGGARRCHRGEGGGGADTPTPPDEETRRWDDWK